MSEERISVRRRSAADLDACVRVLAEVHENDGYPVNWPQDPSGWLAPLAPPESPDAWVALLDDRIVGHVRLDPGRAGDTTPDLWSSRTGLSPAGTGVVSRLFVSPKARGHGVGTLLLAETVREARAGGLYPVLEVVISHRSAAALYERQGWTLMATGERRWGPDQTVRIHSYAAPAVPSP